MKLVTWDEMLALCRRHGINDVVVNVVCRVNPATMAPMTFDFGLVPAKQPHPDLQHWAPGKPLPPSPYADHPLNEYHGVEPEGESCWFDDGYPLPDYDPELGTPMTFTESGERKGTAIERVVKFMRFVDGIEAQGFNVAFDGVFLQPLMQWGEITGRAEEDPAFAAEIAKILPRDHPKAR